jgi:Tol biopolymer transport system component
VIHVANENIDSHVVYRLINPAYALWWNMGIYQRNLENYHEEAIFTNRMTQRNCMNCHSFCNNRPEKMLFHMRAEIAGTMLVTDGEATKIDTKTDQTLSPGVYPAWHPGGNHVAFSVNKITQSFHAQKDHSINVYDEESDLIVYDIQTHTVTTSPKVTTRRLENLPAWSPDGRVLYFCSGPEWKEGADFRKVQYDLMRVACDVETNQWGDVETVLSSSETGKSITFPRVSPDGRYLLFSMSDYGYFAIHYPSSDLYLLDLGTNDYRKLDVNSERSESYHSWSSSSRWFVFASKREDGLCSRLYFSYLDSSGNASKPFLMPQKDPSFYDTYIMNFNAPEMTTGPVKTSHWTLMNASFQPPVKASFVPANAK